MVSTALGDRQWAKRHGWIVVLIAVQATGLALGAVIRHESSFFAFSAVITVIGPAIVTSLPTFGRNAIAAVASATLLAQAILMVALFGDDIRPSVILLADLCVIALYQSPLLFAGSFATAAAALVGLTIADPALFGLIPGNTEDILAVLLCSVGSIGVGAIALGTLWIEHHRLRHEHDQQTRVTEAYMAVTGSILIVLDRDGVVRSANRRACLMLDREEDEVVGQEWYAMAYDDDFAAEGRAWLRTAFGEQQPIYQPGEYNYENVVISRSGEERFVSWWATVLEDGEGQPVGMVCSGEDITEKRLAKAEVERGRTELDALRRLAQKVASLDDARQAICDAAVALTGARMVAIAEPDRTRETLTYLTSTDDSVLGYQIHLGREASLLGAAFLGGQPQFMSELSTMTGVHKGLADAATAGQAGSALHQPITGANGTIGVLSVAWSVPIDSLGDRRAELIGLIATEAAIALRRRESLAQLERAALVDPLTGVANRRAFDAELPLALRRATEGGYPLSLVVMDLNDFKAVNDVLGHEAGDDVLIKAAGAWAGALRAGDLLSRIGGDEFTVLLPTCDEAEMNHIIARLRAVTPHGPGTSLGGVVWDGSETVASLIRRADTSQYEDKARSKQQVRRTPSGLPARTPERRRPRHQDPRSDTLPPRTTSLDDDTDLG